MLLFGCEQCRPPGGSDLELIGLGIWAVLVFSVLFIAALHQQSRR